MPKSSKFSSEMCAESRGSGVKVWENYVVEHMRNWFEHTEKPRVFRLQGSADSPSPASWEWNHGPKTIAHTAMVNLGGQATLKQLKEEISRMPESSRLSSLMHSRRKHRMVWHVTLGR